MAKRQQDPELTKIDPQELEERTEAAKAYAIEDPDSVVDYCHACIQESEKATTDTRYLWDECYKAYRHKIDYSNKQDWQSKMTTGDMTATVKQANAIVRKAFRQPDWMSVEPQGEDDVFTAQFYRDMLEFWLNPQHAKFGTRFSDGCELGFAIGQSHEIIPRWQDGIGLVLDLVPPWQIYRDPDAQPRDPWSGNYWAHMEWMDLWRVQALAGQGKYTRIEEVTANEGVWPASENQEKRARRKGQYYQRNTYRHAVRVVEQWGVILDKQGNMLLPNARFMIAGDVLILEPEPSPLVTIPWPGVSFSPLPDMFTFDGHGIVEPSLWLWLATCNLMNLHIDDMSWRVNRMRQVNRYKLEDPTDVDLYPGKLWLTSKDVQAGAKVIEDIFEAGNTNEILATLQHYDARRENSSFVNQFVAGLPGQRSNITKGEVEIKTEQSMGIFDSIGEDIEEGAIHVLKACIEMLVLNWSEYTYPAVSRVFPEDQAAAIFSQFAPEQRKEMLQANCDIKVSGVTAQIKNSDLIPRLQFIMAKAEGMWGKYVKPYELFTQVTNTLGFYDPDFAVSPEEAMMIDEAEAQMQAEAIAAQTAGKVTPLPGTKPIPGGM
jgi:hypothetical protein